MSASESILHQPSSPEHIALLLEIGLETNHEDDRLLALSAANSFDSYHGTAYGREVVEAFMGQLGVVLQEDSESIIENERPQQEVYCSETPRVARFYKEVFNAIGQSVHANLEIAEFIMQDAEGVPLVANANMLAGARRLSPLPIDSSDTFMLDLSQERPFALHHTYMGDMGCNNIHKAIRAVMGLPASNPQP